MDNQSGLDILKESDFDWFNYSPHLLITGINNIDLSVLHDHFLNKTQSFLAAQILGRDISEIDDDVSDFIQDSWFSIQKDEIDKL
jgi:hypothetical protein